MSDKTETLIPKGKGKLMFERVEPFAEIALKADTIDPVRKEFGRLVAEFGGEEAGMIAAAALYLVAQSIPGVLMQALGASLVDIIVGQAPEEETTPAEAEPAIPIVA